MSLADRLTRPAFVAGVFGFAALASATGWWLLRPSDPPPWTDGQIGLLRSLWIGSLPPLPPDPTNAVADDPRAAGLGHTLFFDTRLSGNGRVACATCHQPERRFTDGTPKGNAIGESERNTMSIVGAAYSPWLYWDGRKDSLWSQALSPLEDSNEMGGNRVAQARVIVDDPRYRAAYEALFGPLPDLSDPLRFPAVGAPVHDATLAANWRSMAAEDQALVTKVFVNIGKAIAAYERLLIPSPSRFDAYAQAVLDEDPAAQQAAFNANEVRGLRLFIGEAACIQCHNGSLFTNNEFHNTGVLSFPGEVPDQGRIDGVRMVRNDPFNCRSDHSDDPNRSCPELEFARDGVELIGAFRTPPLRNLEGTSPYMHKGQISTLAEVLDHYNRAPLAMIGHNEAKPLNLNGRELEQLEAILETLSAPLETGAGQPGNQ